jgi:hypothetical protein
MNNTNNTNSASNQYINTSPQAVQNLNKMKYEIASQLGVNLKQGYNGDLTSREAGSVGGEMGKRMISYASENMR